MSDKLDSRVKALIAKPNSKNVHDMRTSIRRIEATFKLLPKDIRKRHTLSDYLTGAKSLFRATSPIRDIDIVKVNLRKFETITEISDLLKRNEEKRAHFLIAATRSAKRFEKIPPPRIRASQISESRLAKRRKKLVRRFEDNLREQIQIMLSNPKPEQLHDFRKNCKMLRYTLEIDSSKKKLLMTLENLQTILGSLMDTYTTLQYVSESSLGETIAPIVDQLNSSKNRDYARFVSTLRRRFDTEPAKSSQKKAEVT
jgi:CHAD domain-containing protein